VREAEIMLLPSTVYDYDDQHVRVGFGRENLPEGWRSLINSCKPTTAITFKQPARNLGKI
jgi:hypothetical protein